MATDARCPPARPPTSCASASISRRAFTLAQAQALVEACSPSHHRWQAIDPRLAAHSRLAMGEQAARLMISDPVEYTSERLVEFAEDVLRALR